MPILEQLTDAIDDGDGEAARLHGSLTWMGLAGALITKPPPPGDSAATWSARAGIVTPGGRVGPL